MRYSSSLRYSSSGRRADRKPQFLTFAKQCGTNSPPRSKISLTTDNNNLWAYACEVSSAHFDGIFRWEINRRRFLDEFLWAMALFEWWQYFEAKFRDRFRNST